MPCIPIADPIKRGQLDAESVQDWQGSMSRGSNKTERPGADPSKEWVIEIVASTEPQNRLGRAIDLILNAERRVKSPDLGGPGSPGSDEDLPGS